MTTPTTKFYLLLTIAILIMSCNPKEKPTNSTQPAVASKPQPKPNPQIADYIREIFQDKNGNLWLGTNGYGVAHVDGDSVAYYSNAQGFNGQQITGITEDPEKNIWFATDQGVVKYDWSINKNNSKQFTNYTEQQYFEGQRFWSIFADSKGMIWAGSATGIFRFNGKNWAPFKLPYPEKVSGKFITTRTAWSITEDKKGNIWFSTNGFGTFKYDGQSFTQYAKKEGLTDNSVDVIWPASNGDIWFGTRFGGISQFDGKTFNNSLNDRIGNQEVCSILEDKNGTIWFSAEGFGVYRYDGTTLSNYSEKEGLGVRAVQAIYEDRAGKIWTGGGGGLYRLKEGTFHHVSKNGPWN